MLMRKLALSLLLAPLGALTALADQVPPELAAIFPGLTASQVRPAPMPGFHEVRVGAQILYVSTDGRFLVQGELFDVASETNLTEQRRASARVEAVDDVSEGTMIVFAPPEFQHTITVFTDIDCGYCRRMHQHMEEYNRLGIAIEYLFFPRAGMGSDSFDKAVSVWCSDDRHKAMDEAKAGVVLDKKQCSNPIEADYDLGNRIGVTGTPAVFTESGLQLGGYMPPDQLLQRLEQLGDKVRP